MKLKTLKLLLKARVKQIDTDRLFLSFNGVEGFYLPYGSKLGIDQRQLFMVSEGYDNWLLHKYTTDQIIIKETDVVVDCGAFVGGFTIAAAKAGAAKIYSIEPSSKNYKTLHANLAHYGVEDKAETKNIGLGEEPGELQLNLSKSGCDDSFLEPDEGDLGQSETVEIKTLSDFIQEEGIDPDNLYLKVEAEGFEPEIVYGLRTVDLE